MDLLRFPSPRKPLQKEIFISDVYDFETSFPLEHKEVLSYNFPTQIQVYVNIGFFLLLVPYRISFDGSNWTLKTNLLQKILCGIVYCFIAVYRLCEILKYRISHTITSNPSTIFYVASTISFAIQSMVCLNTFWRARSGFLAISNIPRRRPNAKVYLVAVFICGAALCYGAYNQQQILGHITNEARFRRLARKYYRTFLFQTRVLTPEDMKPVVYVLTIITAILETFSVLFAMYAEAVSVFAALAVYEIMSKFKTFLLSVTKWDQKLLKSFSTCTLFSKTIDEFHSSIYLWTFANIITFMSISLMDIFNSTDISESMFTLMGVVYYTFMLCFAAEAYEMGRTCKSLMMDLLLFNEKQEGQYLMYSSNVAWQLKNLKIGLRGGNFFTVTYPFIGATISAVLTYVLVVIQFSLTTSCPAPATVNTTVSNCTNSTS